MLWLIVWRQRRITGEIYGPHEHLGGRVVSSFDSIEGMAKWVDSFRHTLDGDKMKISYTFEVRTTVSTIISINN